MMRFAKAVASLHDDLAVSGELNRVAALLRDVVGESSMRFDKCWCRNWRTVFSSQRPTFVPGPSLAPKRTAKALGKWSANFDAASRAQILRRVATMLQWRASILIWARRVSSITPRRSLPRSRSTQCRSSKQFEFTERLVAFLYAIKVHQHQGNELLAQCEPTLRSMSIHAEALRDRFEAERAPYDVRGRHRCCGARRWRQHVAHVSRAAALAASGDLPASLLVTRVAQRPPRSITAAVAVHQRVATIRPRNAPASAATCSSARTTFAKTGSDDFSPSMRANSRYSRTVSDESERFPLLLCTVREARDSDRPNSFEVVSPARVLTLMAEDDQMMRTWIKVIRNAIAASLNNQIAQPARRGRELAMSDSSRRAEAAASAHRRPQAAVIALLRKGDAANRLCADCGEPDPTWASISLGVLLCIECAGVHRRIGVHVTKVRSLELDTWPPCDTQLVARLGNAVTNAVFERAVSTDVVRGKPGVGADVLEAWIRAKYELRRFVGNPSPKRDHNALGHALCTAAALDDVRQVQALLALDPTIIDWRNGSTGPPLLSAAAGSVVVLPYDKLPVPYDSSDATTTRDEHKNLWQGAASLAYLLHRGAAYDVRGAGGVSVMHVLARRDSAPLLNAALVGGAMCDATDDNGRTPIDEAMRVQAADAVTFLRLAALAFPDGAEQHQTRQRQRRRRQRVSVVVSRVCRRRALSVAARV
jgi:hypothetical protein